MTGAQALVRLCPMQEARDRESGLQTGWRVGHTHLGRLCPEGLCECRLAGALARTFDKRLRAWDRIARDLSLDKLEAVVGSATLSDVPGLGAEIPDGKVRGPVVVDMTGRSG